MSVNILGKSYDIKTTIILYLSNRGLTECLVGIGNLTNLQYLYLNNNNLKYLPPEIGNLTNLRELYLNGNNLTKLAEEIGNLTNLQKLYLHYNSLTILPAQILKIKNILSIDETSYEINNMDPDAEFIILSRLKTKITNLPVSLKEIWLRIGVDASLIKVPFGCEIKYFL